MKENLINYILIIDSCYSNFGKKTHLLGWFRVFLETDLEYRILPYFLPEASNSHFLKAWDKIVFASSEWTVSPFSKISA